MPDAIGSRRISRRNLLKAAGLTAAAVGLAPSVQTLWLGTGAPVARGVGPDPQLKLVGTDGWISLPKTPAIPTFHPDVLAPEGYSTYIFGFRNVTGLDDVQTHAQKNHAQHSAPLSGPSEARWSSGPAIGLRRPDLFDAHTLHWHGFKNVIAFFDGEPTGSIAIPAGQTFTYVYMSHDPGTYMYHCHVEDVEHVQMGMTGLVFVRPKQDDNASMRNLGLGRRPNNLLLLGLSYLQRYGDGSTGLIGGVRSSC